MKIITEEGSDRSPFRLSGTCVLKNPPVSAFCCCDTFHRTVADTQGNQCETVPTRRRLSQCRKTSHRGEKPLSNRHQLTFCCTTDDEQLHSIFLRYSFKKAFLHRNHNLLHCIKTTKFCSGQQIIILSNPSSC